jgi:hypothetical protein
MMFEQSSPEAAAISTELDPKEIVNIGLWRMHETLCLSCSLPKIYKTKIAQMTEAFEEKERLWESEKSLLEECNTHHLQRIETLLKQIESLGKEVSALRECEDKNHDEFMEWYGLYMDIKKKYDKRPGARIGRFFGRIFGRADKQR